MLFVAGGQTIVLQHRSSGSGLSSHWESTFSVISLQRGSQAISSFGLQHLDLDLFILFKRCYLQEQENSQPSNQVSPGL